MPYNFGDVLLVPLPFTSQAASKGTPAVVVKGTEYARDTSDVIAMPITWQIKTENHGREVWISEWEAAGLLKSSAVKPVFAMLEQTLVIRKLGVLQTADQQALTRLIASTLRTVNSPTLTPD